MAVETIETGTDTLRALLEDGVAVLTINRPERRNAINLELSQALARTLTDLQFNTKARCVVISGAGGTFCAGGDIKEMVPGAGLRGQQGSQGARVLMSEQLQLGIVSPIYHMSKPVIAALPGPAAGAGASIALACDLRIAADTAFLTMAFAGVALSGDSGGAFFLTQLVGAAKARELLLFSERIPAAKAAELGLVNLVVPAKSLEEETMKVARRLANGPTVAFGFMKKNVALAAGGASLRDYLSAELLHHTLCGLTDDAAEAIKAFGEKREPRFQGS